MGGGLSLVKRKFCQTGERKPEGGDGSERRNSAGNKGAGSRAEPSVATPGHEGMGPYNSVTRATERKLTDACRVFTLAR